ncbi:FecR family protein [Pseudoxanthomonas sp. GM95]|uniref:FecR family protein n=1 Tax=Pseudoxanthomonas sp. GM95 TaxID=1881043 RepID=UPI0008CF82D5|nr:FecR domain-containing protein [Pseudoxanthomonas sp. GM95]SEL59715.1 FecR family protein [Pseudoxanthomonas sp. GM95]
MSDLDFDQATLTEQAAHWHALQRAGGLNPVQQARFMDWLVATPEHLREYLAVARVASELGDALRAMQLDVDALLDGAPSPARTDNVVALPARGAVRAVAPRKPRRAWPQALAAGVALACVGITAYLAWPQTRHYVAAHGAPQRFELPDRTVVHLNAESALSMRFGLFDRKVTLERGQASFVVAVDRRPFQVQAAGLQVRDIGTTFDVSLRREQARIDVAEGQVHVIGADGDGPMLADLHAGQSARIDYRDDSVSVQAVDVGAMTAWWQRRVVFRDEPLREVAEQFNRLNRTRLQLDDDAAGALRLTGNLRGDDLASLRAFLDDQPTLVTQLQAGTLRVGTRHDAPAELHRR